MTQIYDLGYKKLFSNKKLFQELIESFVPYNWVKELDFNHCELLDKSFISEQYKKRESDIVYKVKLRGKTAYIVILLEFQSSTNKFMAVRILHYITSFYMRLIESKERPNKLPPVFPIVLYNGLKKWTASDRISPLIENNDLLGELALDFKYFTIAENEIATEKLLEIGNAVSALFLGEVHYDREVLLKALSALLKQEDQQVISILFNYFEQLFNHDKLAEVDWNSLNEVRTKQEINMFLENMKICDEKAYEKGILAGILEGERKGKLEGERKGKLEGERKGKLEGERAGLLKNKLATAKMMMTKGFEISLIAEITGLSLNKIKQLKDI